MAYIKNLCFVLIALFAVMMDVSFFSFMPIAGATLLVSFVSAVIIAIYRKKEELIIYLLSVVLFFAIFSSLPFLIITLNFLLLPHLFHFVRNRFFPEPTVFTGLVYLAVALILFQLLLLGYWRQLELKTLVDSGYFILLNTLIGMIIQLGYQYLQKRKSKEIRF